MLTATTRDKLPAGMPRPMKLREGDDRRVQDDRRRSSVSMRLRVGLWYQYHRVTRSGEFDPFPRNQYKRAVMEEALLPEIVKYQFVERDNQAATAAPAALAKALDFLWAHPEVGCNAAGESMAVYAVNAISEYLVRTFAVTILDRRKTDRRTAQAAS